MGISALLMRVLATVSLLVTTIAALDGSLLCADGDKIEALDVGEPRNAA
jgi:hypothetical protein